MGTVSQMPPDAGNGNDDKHRDDADNNPQARPQALKDQRPLAAPHLALEGALQGCPAVVGRVLVVSHH